MAQDSADYSRGLDALRSAAVALEGAGLDHWFFGGWAVDLWVGRLTRPHDDIDLLVWRRDALRVDEALAAAGWTHAPTPEDLVGTNYVVVMGRVGGPDYLASEVQHLGDLGAILGKFLT